MKNLILKSLFMITLITASISLQAQSSVYFCSVTGAYGYCYGQNSVDYCAYNTALNYGAVSPYKIVSTRDDGYGAIAVGQDYYGNRVVGAAVGYSSRSDAIRRAKSECARRGGSYISVADTWID